jgi:NAD(P)-dependent dehydrogenase (short-subunit alcohol dehydrogenase family)
VGERERADKVAAKVTALGRRAWTVRLDQADAAMPEHGIAATVPHFGRLDVLVNNAAWMLATATRASG